MKGVISSTITLVLLCYANGSELKEDSCTSFVEKPTGKVCLEDFKSALYKAHNEWCFGSSLKYQDPPGPLIGLWSYPGSGNTWMRYLIQKATGYIVSSEYMEHAEFEGASFFHGGGVFNGSAIAVKSHLHHDKNIRKFDKAILIVRNPVDCFMSEVNRELQNSFENAPYSKWEPIKDLDGTFYKRMFPNWMEFHEKIIEEYKKPLLIVEFSAMKEDIIGQLARVMKFLNQDFTDELKRCISADSNGPFSRASRPKHEKEKILKKITKAHLNRFERSYGEIVEKLKKTFEQTSP